jgi:MFS transporter, PHS family, inorganic phosphate transporter
MDVSHDGERALLDTRSYHGTAADEATTMADIGIQAGAAGGRAGNGPLGYLAYHELKTYFSNQGNWLYLVSISICCFLLDFAFYGLGLNNPHLLLQSGLRQTNI